MPFTPSHAVVALPFIRTPLVPAAIAIGAMTPDLPLFIGIGIPYSTLHNLALAPIAVGLALALLLVWRLVLRPAVLDLAPRWIGDRLPQSWDQTRRQTLRETFVGTRGALPTTILLVVSLILGVVSHVVWDSFTHEGRGGVNLIPALAHNWGALSGYRWLQYGSSVLGLVVIAVWAVIWWRNHSPHPVRRVLPGAVRVGWWLSLPALLIGFSVNSYARYGGFGPEFTVPHLVYDAMPTAAGVWLFLTLALSAVTVMIRDRGISQ